MEFQQIAETDEFVVYEDLNCDKLDSGVLDAILEEYPDPDGIMFAKETGVQVRVNKQPKGPVENA